MKKTLVREASQFIFSTNIRRALLGGHNEGGKAGETYST
jgi:hypothetical protein